MMKKILNPWINKEGYFCFGCCPTNPYGVHMEFLEDGDDVVSLWKPSIFYQGWLNTMHGGILSTLVDEISGWVVSRKLQTSGMTTHLDVHYRKAVSTQDPQLTIRAHITEMKRNIALINVTIHNSSGELCVEGQATYFCMNAERARAMGFEECKVEK